MVEQFSLALMDHQITHFKDDIDGLEIGLLFHKRRIIIIIVNVINYYIIE